MTPRPEGAVSRVHVAALLLIIGLVAGPGQHARLLAAGRHLGALHRRRPRRSGDDGHTRSRRRGDRAAGRRGAGRPGAGRVVAADIRVRADDSAFRVGAGGGLPARDGGGLHLEQGGLGVVDVRAGLARDCSARGGRGGLGRRVASSSPSAPDSALALKEATLIRSLERRSNGGEPLLPPHRGDKPVEGATVGRTLESVVRGGSHATSDHRFCVADRWWIFRRKPARFINRRLLDRRACGVHRSLGPVCW